MTRTWRDMARPIIAETLQAIGWRPGDDEAVARRALRDAYPFTERRYWPYKGLVRRSAAATARAGRGASRDRPPPGGAAVTPWLAGLGALAKEATPGPWFVAGRPWDDRETAIYGDRRLTVGPPNDPHGARLIADLDVTEEWVEGEPDQSDVDRANARYLAACSPERIAALVAVAEAAGDMRRAVPGHEEIDAARRLDAALATLEQTP